MSEEALLVIKLVRENKLDPDQGLEFLKALGPSSGSASDKQASESASSAVMNLVQDNKLDPEQGLEYIKAIQQQSRSNGIPRPTPPEPPAPPHETHHSNGGQWGSVDQMRSAMADMQQKLAEAQAKLSAAEAQQNAGDDRSGQQPIRLPFGMGEINIPLIIDEAVRGLSAVRSEVVIGAKSAARQAQREARRFRRSGSDFKFDFNFTGMGDDQFAGDPAKSSVTVHNFTVPASPNISIVNEHGDVHVTGVSTDGQVHLTLEKQSWATSTEEAQEDMDAVTLRDERPDGGAVIFHIDAEQGARRRRIRVDVLAEVPADSVVSVKCTHGDIFCEKLGGENIHGQVKSAETVQGNIRLMQIRGNSESVATRLYTGSGDIALTQWTGADINVNTQSGSLQLDVVNGADFELRSKSGDAEIKSIKASRRIQVDTSSGNVTVTDFYAEALMRAKSMSGNVTAERGHAAEISIESASGDVIVEKCAAPSGKIAVVSISGNVEIRDAHARELFSNSTSGDSTVESPSGVSVNAASVSGNVKVYVPQTSSGTVSMVTVSGEIKSDFDLSGGDDSKRYRSGRFGPATEEADLPKIALQSVSGDVRLKQQRAAE